MKTETSTPVTGPWNEVALEQLRRYVPAWEHACHKVTTNLWQGVLACIPGVSILAKELTKTARTVQDSRV